MTNSAFHEAQKSSKKLKEINTEGLKSITSSSGLTKTTCQLIKLTTSCCPQHKIHAAAEVIAATLLMKPKLLQTAR